MRAFTIVHPSCGGLTLKSIFATWQPRGARSSSRAFGTRVLYVFLVATGGTKVTSILQSKPGLHPQHCLLRPLSAPRRCDALFSQTLCNRA